MNYFRRLVRLGLILSLPGCATHVSNTAAYAPPPAPAAPLPPARVLVENFTASPGIVQLDTSPGAIVKRQAAGLSAEAAQQKDVADVQSAITETLVQDIKAMGLPAVAAAPGTSPGPSDLMVTGQIAAINEGSRARRVVVGFGAGKSSVTGNAQLLRGVSGGSPAMLQTYNFSADSGHMPGMGVGAAAGGAKSAATAVSGAAHAEGEVERSPAGQHGETIAKQLAGELGAYFTSQGWITAAR